MQLSEFDKSKLKSVGITIKDDRIFLTGVKSKKIAGSLELSNVKSIALIETDDVESDALGFIIWISNLRRGGSNSFAEEIIHKIVITSKDNQELRSKIVAFDKIGATKAIERLNANL